MVLQLTRDDLSKVWTMQAAVESMRQLCVTEAAGHTISAERIHIPLSHGFIRILPGVLIDEKVLGYKEFHSGSDGMRVTIHLFDLESGAPLAHMDASQVTLLRTGAMGAVAMSKLVDPTAQTVGVIGSGKEAMTALEGLALVRPDIKSGSVFSPNPTRRADFASAANTNFGFELRVADSAPDAVGDVDVVIAATNSFGRIALEGSWLRPGIHINSIGSTALEQREIDPEVWRLADRIVIDTPRLLHESGDAVAAAAENAFDPESIVTIADAFTSEVPIRTSPDQTTMYKSVGTGLQDMAAAYRIYTEAQAAGLGHDVDDFVLPLSMVRPGERK